MSEHHDDVIMGVMASQITSLTIVCSTVYSDADQRKHQMASYAEMFPFHDVITSSWISYTGGGTMVVCTTGTGNTFQVSLSNLCDYIFNILRMRTTGIIKMSAMLYVENFVYLDVNKRLKSYTTENKSLKSFAASHRLAYWDWIFSDVTTVQIKGKINGVRYHPTVRRIRFLSKNFKSSGN